MTLRSPTPKIQPLKRQKGNKAEEKKVVQADLTGASALEAKSEVNVMTKDFPYPEFMDKELMTPAALERLEGDEDDLVAKF